MRNQQIRLTESDLHFIVEESVRNILIQEGFFGNMWNGVKNVAGGVADLAKAGGNAIGGMYYTGQANGQEYEQMQQQYQQKIQQIDQQIQTLQQKAAQKQNNMNQNMQNFNGRMSPQNYQTTNLGGGNQQQQPQQQMQVQSQQQQVKPRQKRTVKKQQPMQQSQLPQ